jgi:hypothetical protein
MIGDVLHEALADIERYQSDPATSHCYEGPAVKAKIASVTSAMRDLLRDFDTPPGTPTDVKEEANGRPL